MSTCLITVLMTCEPPPVVEDSLVRVSSAAEKRSQDAAEELQRQRSNQTNPDAETAAGWSISRDGSEFPVETNVVDPCLVRFQSKLQKSSLGQVTTARC